MNAWAYEDAWMNALGLFVTFVLRMNVCYLHGSTWILDETLDENEYMIRETLDENEYMIRETLDENTFYEICMNVWSHRWMYEWMNPDFLYDYFLDYMNL